MKISKRQIHQPIKVASNQENIVTPGQVLSGDLQFMRGHGTYTMKESLIASVAGKVERVNKLVSVKPLKTR